MKKIYLIILGPDVEKENLIQRIKGMGDVYVVFGNNVFVCSEKETAQDIYTAIATNDIGQQTSVVLDLGSTPKYWGYTKKELWAWFKKHSENDE